MDNLLGFGMFLLFALTPMLVLVTIKIIDKYLNK